MSNRRPWRWLSEMVGNTVNVDPKIRLLSKSEAFQRLTKNEIQQAAKQFDEVTVAAGTVLIQEGERNRTLWLIAEGHVQVSIRGRVVREHGPGELIGLPTLLNGGVAGVTARAYGLLSALVASEMQFWPLMSNPKVELVLRATCARRVRRDFFSLLSMTREQPLATL